MLGAIIGDTIGSKFEFNNIYTEDFDLFSKKSTYTDDTVLSVAVAEVLLYGGEYSDTIIKYATTFKNRGYGGMFAQMIRTGKLTPYNSFGNGSAMRVSPVGWVHGTLKETLEEAKKSADCSHNHEEGVKGAQAVAGSVYLARNGKTKEEIVAFVEALGYDLSKSTNQFPKKFDVTCQGTIPRCMAAFRETDDFEGAIRRTVSIGGDVDTNAAIVGSIAEAFYGGVPRDMVEEVYTRMPQPMANIVTAFVKEHVDKDFVEPDEVGIDPLSDMYYDKGLFSSDYHV